MPDDQDQNAELNVVGDAAETASREVNPIDEAVSMEARVMLKSIKIPADSTLSPDLCAEVRKAVKTHIKSYRITYSTISKQIGVGESTISETLKGKYKGDSDTVLRKLNAWIDDDERRRGRDRPLGFYETNVFKSIRDLARIAKRNAVTDRRRVVGDDKPRIVIGYGPPGCGKTLGIDALCAEDTTALKIRVRTGGGTGNAVARAVLEAAGFRGRPQNVGNLEYIIDKLRYSGRLLIVDEAHKLGSSGFEVLRDLADDAGIPIMLLGTDRTNRKIERSRRGMDDFMDDQFSRRVGLVVDLLRGSDGEGGSKRPIFSLDEVRAIFKDDTVRLSGDGLELLCAIANTIGIGMLGMAVNIYEKAQYAARRKPNNEINADLLWKACERVLLPAGFEFMKQADPIKQQIATSLNRVRELKRAAG